MRRSKSCALGMALFTAGCASAPQQSIPPTQVASAKPSSAQVNPTPSAAVSALPSASSPSTSKLLTPPTLAEAGGKCICGAPRQIGTSKHAGPAVHVVPEDLEPAVYIAANSEEILAAWEDEGHSLTTLRLDPDDALPVGSANAATKAVGTWLTPLADGTFSMIGTDHAWILSQLGGVTGSAERPMELGQGEVNSTAFGSFYLSEAFTLDERTGLRRTFLTHLDGLNRSPRTTDTELVSAEKDGRVYLTPAIGASGHWYVVSSFENSVRLESQDAAPQEFDRPADAKPIQLAVDAEEHVIIEAQVENGHSVVDKFFRLARDQRAPVSVPVPDRAFQGSLITGSASAKWAYAGRGPLDFDRLFLGRAEMRTEAAQCVIAPSVSPYVRVATTWAKGAFVVIYEDGQPKNYRIFVSRVTCNG